MAKWFLMGCLVSIFIVRITSKSFPWAVCCVPERDFPKCLLSDMVQWYTAVLLRPGAKDMALVWPSEWYIEEKQTELETESN